MYDELSTFTHPTVYRDNQCIVCERYFHDDDIVATVTDDSSSVTVASENSAHCCAHCAEEHSGHGKFEAADDVATALVLYQWSMTSSEDDVMTNDGWGYVGRFGRYLLMEDDRGFVTYEEYDDAVKADARFEGIYNDGMGAQEDDAYIGHETYHGWRVSFAGKMLDVPARPDGSTDERRALAVVVLEMYRTGYFPNVWRENHYGVELVSDVPGGYWASSKGVTATS